MKVFPTAYFGSIGYFKKLVQYDTVFLEAKEHFPKQTYRNRCDIVSADGILSLSIPVKKPHGNKTLTEDIVLSNEENWKVRHWRSIKTAYQSAPYFDYYGMEVEEILQSSENNLLKFNSAITQKILNWLDIETEILTTSAFYPVQENDWRETLVKKNSFSTTEKAPYIQVFPSEHSFQESLSILDAIMCIGPMARKILKP